MFSYKVVISQAHGSSIVHKIKKVYKLKVYFLKKKSELGCM